MMGQFTQISAKGICLLLCVAMATAAIAAPNGDASTSQDCFSRAGLQHALDYARCGALPFESRNPCLIQAEQNYAAAVAACATAGAGQKAVTIKQNVEAPFVRRLRN